MSANWLSPWRTTGPSGSLEMTSGRMRKSSKVRGGGTFEERQSWAYQRALTREPTAREIELLRALFDQQRARYRTDESGASALLRVGEAPLPKGNAPELAAWTGVARAILNLNEVVTRN